MEAEVMFSRTTLAEQVAESMEESVRRGRLSENSKLPSSRELARQYGVSHNVMLKALRQLHKDDLIYMPSRRIGYLVKQW